MRHEVHLARHGFAALAAVSAACVAVAALVAGANGARSALIGAALIAANHAVAVSSIAWSRTVDTRVIAVGYSLFMIRLLGLLAAFAWVVSFGWLHSGLFVAGFCAALVASLAAECVSYVRGSYVPQWRTR